MSELTNFLKLFKWNTEDENDLKSEFDIDKSMNDNCDKLDDFAGKVDSAVIEIQDDIESIQKVDKKQDELIQKLKDNSINITTEEATQLYIEDASELPAALDVRGNHYQKVTETAENVFNGKLEPGEWNYNTGEKTDVENRIRSVDYIDITGQTQISTVKKNGGTFGLAIRFYDADKNYIGRVSSPEVVDGVTNNVNNDLDSTKTVKYATLTILDTSDTTLEFAVNKGADLSWHDFIPNSPSLDYPSDIQVLENSVEIKKINANLLNNKQVFKDIGRSVNGLTISQNEDGSITINGTSSKQTQFWFYFNGIKVIEGYKFDKYVKSGNISDEKNLSLEFYNKDIKQVCLSNYNNNYVKNDDIITSGYVKISEGATFDNYTINYAISKETLDNFVENEETNYTLPIQQSMLKGDCFDLEPGKEIHSWDKVVLTGAENILINTETDNYIEYQINSALPYNSKSGYNNTVSTHFSNTTNNRCLSNNKNLLIRIPKPTNLISVDLFKEWLAENNVTLFYEVAEVIELDLTEEQKQVLQQLKELNLFKGTNNIITAEDLALLQLNYIVDTQSYIDNRIDEKLANINTQILELAGGK